MKWFSLLAFIATIPAANWLIDNVGTVCIPNGPCLIPVGFGLMAPSGVLLIGLALVLRDHVYEAFGRNGALMAILAGAALSMFSPGLALASAAAFLIAELADMAVYSKLRARGLWLGVLASGVVGAFVDSAAFTYLAFGSFEFSAGNAVGKIYASAIVAALVYGFEKRQKKWT
jgi:uncharacterized PurR-regulated membrane protein YhhQ (DUF165 family)